MIEYLDISRTSTVKHQTTWKIGHLFAIHKKSKRKNVVQQDMKKNNIFYLTSIAVDIYENILAQIKINAEKI